MSKIKIIDPQLINEMYISNTGESGLSQAAIAKLCGVSEMTVCRLVSDDEKMSYILGEEITTEDLYLAVVSKNQAKMIKAEIAGEIILHYALDKRLVALYSLTEFAIRGMDNWIKDCVQLADRS